MHKTIKEEINVHKIAPDVLFKEIMTEIFQN